MKTISILAYLVVVSCGAALNVSAANQPTGTTAGSTLNEYRSERKQENMMRRLEELSLSPAVNAPEMTELPGGREAVYIVKILIQSCTDTDYNERPEIRRVIKDFLDKSLTITDMKKAAAVITGQCKAENLKAYIPKQACGDRTLYINLEKVPISGSY